MLLYPTLNLVKFGKTSQNFFSIFQKYNFRLNQEKMVEKERQAQHIDYLKDCHKTQIKNLENAHLDNIDSSASEWKLKFDDVNKRSKLETQLQRENFEQKMIKFKSELESTFAEKSSFLEEQLREKVKIERDLEIERAVNRIETEMEKVRSNAEQMANNKVLRVQQKMQKEVDNAEQVEKDAMKKYMEAKQKVNNLSEELMAEKHKLNLTAVELNDKEDRLNKLLSER
jgi:5-azacytidine-induced protein 1